MRSAYRDVWTALPHHKSDSRGFPNDDAAGDAMKPQHVSTGFSPPAYSAGSGLALEKQNLLGSP
jgi:hypothetical protein